jgi:predicted membrane metal-binding protein
MSPSFTGIITTDLRRQATVLGVALSDVNIFRKHWNTAVDPMTEYGASQLVIAAHLDAKRRWLREELREVFRAMGVE